MVVISVYVYGVKIINKFRWECGFLRGEVPWNPLCTNGSAGYLMQLSVKSVILVEIGGHFVFNPHLEYKASKSIRK